MTRKYSWDQFTGSCARLTVSLYDSDKSLVGLITVVYMAGSVQSCSFDGSSYRPLMVGQEICAAISKGLLAFTKEGDYKQLEALFGSSEDVY